MEIAENFIVFQMGLITLEWPTALLVFGIFLTVVFSLNKLLFQPVLRNIGLRRDLESKNNSAEFDTKKKIENLNVDYQTRLEAIKAEVSAKRTEMTDAANREAHEIMEKAKNRCSDHFKKEESDIDNQFRSELEKTKTLSQEISSLLLAKVSS